MTGANWSDSWGHYAVFTGAKIDLAKFENTDYDHGRFNQLSSGIKVDFSNSYLRHTDFSGDQDKLTNLTGAKFINAKLNNADLRFVNFRNADFTGADLTGAQLHRSDFSGATWVDGKKCADGSIGVCK